LDDDCGSAPLEFLAFGVPSLIVTLIVCQVLVAGYLNNVILDAAMEGALVASAADGTPQAADNRVRRVLQAASPGLVAAVEVSEDTLDGQPAVAVSIRSHSPLLVFGAVDLSQTARALNEVG
jgi:hypothetical protein